MCVCVCVNFEKLMWILLHCVDTLAHWPLFPWLSLIVSRRSYEAYHKGTVFFIFSVRQKWVRYDYQSCCPPTVVYAILHRKCELGPSMQSYPKGAFANPMALFCTTCWPREKLILLLLRLWNRSLQKSSTRKTAINRAVLSQLARLQHNRVSTPLLQKN